MDGAGLVGREWHVRRVREDMDRLRAGAGGLVEVVGEPGIGKTRFLGAVQDLAREAGFRVVAITGCGAGRTQDTECAGVLRRLAVGLFGAPAAGRPGPERMPAGPRVPVVVVLDDAHALGPEAVDFLDLLTRTVAAVPVLCVVAHRERQTPPALRFVLARGTELGVVDRVELGPLSREECARLVGDRAATRRAEELFRDSGGYPLYALALHALRTLPTEDSGRRTPAGPGAYGFGHFEALLLGETVGLSPQEQSVLETAAVLGPVIRPEVLEQVHTRSAPGRFDQALEGVMGRDLLRLSGRALTFRHPLMRRVVYERTSPLRRLSVHAHALAVLRAEGAEPLELAPHIAGSVSLEPLRDAEALVLAGTECESVTPEQAAVWYDRALRLLPSSDDHAARRFEVSRLRAGALARAGRLTDSRDVLQELLRRPGTPGTDRVEDRVEAVVMCAYNDMRLGRPAQACAMLRSEIAPLTSDRTSRERLKLTLELGLSALLAGEYPPVRHDLLWAHDAARNRGERHHQATVLAITACGEAFEGQTALAKLAADSAAALVDALPDALLAERGTLQTLAWAELLLERATDAERHLERAQALLERSGDALAMPHVLIEQAMIHLYAGRLPRALGLARQAQEASRTTGHAPILTAARTLESHLGAWLSPRRGGSRERDAVADAAARPDPAPAAGNRWTHLTTTLRNHTRLSAGHLGACAELLLRPGGPDLRVLAAPLLPQYAETLVTAFLELRDQEQAASLAAFAQEYASRLDLPGQRAHAARAHAHVLAAAGRHDEALTHFRQAEVWFAQAGKKAELARCLRDTARTLARLGRSDDVRSVVRRLSGHIAATGAGCLRGDAERLLATHPLHATTGLKDSLTKREQQVAALAGTGRTNADIARQLGLSKRTIENYLVKIYRKAGASPASRENLGHLLPRTAQDAT